MDQVMSIASHSMAMDVLRLERLSANVANATTPGFKSGLVVQRPVAGASRMSQFESAMAVKPDPLEGSSGPRSTDMNLQVLHDMRPGALKATGQETDVALAGPGFWEVETPGGPAYTRHGQFKLDAQGRLVTQQGLHVMGISGVIDLRGSKAVIDVQGGISIDGRNIATLKVVDFARPQELRSTQGGLFVTDEVPRAVEGAALQVRQGMLEDSNVNTMHEMVDLMKTMRHFESMHRMVQGYDDMLAVAIRKLGDIG